MISLRPATAEDHPEIHYINERAFAQPTEAALIEALRAEGSVVLELIAECGGKPVGHILFSNLPIEGPGRTVRAAALAPMAVHPDFQNRGIGGALVKMSIPMLAHAGFEAILVVGHPDYYPRFGFSAEAAASLESPFPPGPHFMALELSSGVLDGFRGRPLYSRAFGL